MGRSFSAGSAAAPTQLPPAYLICPLNDGRTQYFILEDVATRERQRFDSSMALLAHLKEILLTE
jgi:hypothetical protein